METTARPLRQEQEPASEVVDEVAPGVRRVQLPINMPGLGHVNCYALEDGRGFAIVDPGLPGEAAWADLVAGLARAGIPLRRVHTVVVTHSHPDHFGGAARVRAEAGAEILTHAAFRLWWDPTEPDGEDPETAPDAITPPPLPIERPTPWGGTFRPPTSPEFQENLRSMLTLTPTVRVEDADVVELGRRSWVAVHTPGHTPDHLCLFDPDAGTLLCGDHVLPSITPHISGIGTAEDPLAEFFHSLDRMCTLEGVRVALPAHGHPFTDLAGRAADIKRHHEERLDTLRRASHEIGRPATVEELSQHLFSPRAWGPMAESETYAHLEHLRRAGEATARPRDGFLLYDVRP